jgi:CHAD domain-containing protein
VRDHLRYLLEALQGVLQEQKALQAYATDFVEAHNSGDFGTMRDALVGALRLYILSIKDFEDVPGMDLIIRDLDRAKERLERLEIRSARTSHRRR